MATSISLVSKQASHHSSTVTSLIALAAQASTGPAPRSTEKLTILRKVNDINVNVAHSTPVHLSKLIFPVHTQWSISPKLTSLSREHPTTNTPLLKPYRNKTNTKPTPKTSNNAIIYTNTQYSESLLISSWVIHSHKSNVNYTISHNKHIHNMANINKQFVLLDAKHAKPPLL